MCCPISLPKMSQLCRLAVDGLPQSACEARDERTPFKIARAPVPAGDQEIASNPCLNALPRYRGYGVADHRFLQRAAASGPLCRSRGCWRWPPFLFSTQAPPSRHETTQGSQVGADHAPLRENSTARQRPDPIGAIMKTGCATVRSTVPYTASVTLV
jgi:hypothetical protein